MTLRPHWLLLLGVWVGGCATPHRIVVKIPSELKIDSGAGSQGCVEKNLELGCTIAYQTDSPYGVVYMVCPNTRVLREGCQ